MNCTQKERDKHSDQQLSALHLHVIIGERSSYEGGSRGFSETSEILWNSLDTRPQRILLPGLDLTTISVCRGCVTIAISCYRSDILRMTLRLMVPRHRKSWTRRWKRWTRSLHTLTCPTDILSCRGITTIRRCALLRIPRPSRLAQVRSTLHARLEYALFLPVHIARVSSVTKDVMLSCTYHKEQNLRTNYSTVTWIPSTTRLRVSW